MSTTSIAQDAAIERTNRMQGDMIAAELARQSKGVSFYDGPTTMDVLNHWAMRPYDFGTWIDAATDKQILSTMEVIDPADHTSRFLVTFDHRNLEWRCVCPSFRSAWGEVMIWAVQSRIESNRRARMAAN